MCGIVAICGCGANRYASTVDTMLACLSHRGPDDQGILLKEDVALGQKRLSIMDVAGGHQPIFTGDRRKCIICNGEIYNYLKLKQSLPQHKFVTSSDSESIIHLFEEEGNSCIPKLDGMFAFVLYDGENTLIAQRSARYKTALQREKRRLPVFPFRNQSSGRYCG